MWVGFLIGFIVGGVFGVITMALCVASGRDEDENRK